MENSHAAFDWVRGFTIDFNLNSGLSHRAVSSKRRLSQMCGMFSDRAAQNAVLAADDPLVYEFYELGVPEQPGELSFGASITYPGTVGEEYYMTKGHFHTILETAEVYYCLSGQGFLLLENPEGDVAVHPLSPGSAVYVPRRYAHRSVNTGDAPLVTFFVFDANAGHDYGAIETRGFRKLILRGEQGPVIVDNPNYKEATL